MNQSAIWTVYWGGVLFDLWTDVEVFETMKSLTPIKVNFEVKLVEF